MSLLKTMLLVMSLQCLSACSTAPLKVVCPAPIPPASLLIPPPLLDLLPAKPSLSDIATSVTVNYGRYHELALQVEAWQEWASELTSYLKATRTPSIRE